MEDNSSTGFVLGDLERLHFLRIVAAPLYIACLLVPSLVLNGSVILIFAWKKDVRSPVSLLTVNQCCAGIFSNCLNGVALLVATPITHEMGSCKNGPLLLGLLNWTHFGVNIVNFAAISIAIFLTLKCGGSFFNYTKATAMIIFSWAYSGTWAAILAYIARNVTYIICEAFVTGKGDSVDRTFVGIYMPLIAKVLLLDCLCYCLVLLFCFLSCRTFQRNILYPSEDLKRRMLLLPFLMTSLLLVSGGCFAVYNATVNNGLTISREQYAHTPFIYVSIGQLLFEYDAVIFALLLLYFNNKVRREFKELFKHFMTHGCRCTSIKRSRRVFPISS